MNRHPAAYVVADNEPTEADCEPNSLLDEPDARLRPDTWLPWTCPKCGSDDKDGAPEVCVCGWRNWGAA